MTTPHANPPAPKVAACPDCGTALIPRVDSKQLTAGGLLGAAIFVIGLLILIGADPLAGALAMALGVILGAVARSKRTTLLCPECGKIQKTL